MSTLTMLFPGQGAQAAGMGRELAERFPEAREVFRTADEILGESLSRLCFEGPENELRLTRNTQPALLTVSMAALAAWRSLGGAEPMALAGHSLGEYSAHVAAGTLSLDDALRAVRLRGEAMQQAVPDGQGAMAALMGLEVETVTEICDEQARGQVVSPANLNAPGQVVVAGHAEAVQRVVDRAKDRGARRAVLLPVSAPFHCALMEPAARRLASHLEEITFRDPVTPVVSNVDALPLRTGGEAREALVRQVTAPVRWTDSVRTLGSLGARVGLELGAGTVLGGLMKRIDRDIPTISAGDPDRLEQALAFVGSRTASEGGSYDGT
jgi:[acyl-carrier-protein] S-malonyltransferase